MSRSAAEDPDRAVGVVVDEADGLRRNGVGDAVGAGEGHDDVRPIAGHPPPDQPAVLGLAAGGVEADDPAGVGVGVGGQLPAGDPRGRRFGSFAAQENNKGQGDGGGQGEPGQGAIHGKVSEEGVYR